MSLLQRTPGRKVTRQLTEPDVVLRYPPTRAPGDLARALAEAHNQAVQLYGSNSGGWHAFNPDQQTTAGVFDGGPFPSGTVVSDLAWGKIDDEFAQRLLECDGVA